MWTNEPDRAGAEPATTLGSAHRAAAEAAHRTVTVTTGRVHATDRDGHGSIAWPAAAVR